jgi:superfamily II DNA/RNA helicase
MSDYVQIIGRTARQGGNGSVLYIVKFLKKLNPANRKKLYQKIKE